MTAAAKPDQPAKHIRLFIAVEVPPRVREAIERALGPWRERFPEAKWVRPENRHITVKFLGRTLPSQLEDVRRACAATARAIRPFRIRVAGMGVFPSPGRARVLWVGLRDKEGGLGAVAASLDRGLAGDFPPERRAFSAHLTVARLNPPRPVREQVEELKATEVGAESFRVGSLVLYRSHLSPRGARYEALDRFALRG